MAVSNTQFLEIATAAEPFVLRNGSTIGPARIAYETWGRLNAARDNAILVFHALTGSHHAAGHDEVGPANGFWEAQSWKGWWDAYIGPGRALDTNKHFVVCCNYLGGCYGSTGPACTNPVTGKPWGREFPYPTISDIVDAQIRVLDHLGIDTLLACVGGSLGGFCVADLATRYPGRVRIVIPIASGLRATVLAKALNFEQIFAIAEDANFHGGDYYEHGVTPWRGLALARMISHKTFVSLGVLERRAQDVIIQPSDVLSGYLLEHSIESYLLHQGKKFIRRFDANSYLRIVNAWQSFDLPRDAADGDAVAALSVCREQEWVVFSISSDGCFFAPEQAETVAALKANGIPCQYVTVHSDKGHDAFLVDPDLFIPHIHFALRKGTGEI